MTREFLREPSQATQVKINNLLLLSSIGSTFPKC